MPVIQDKDRHLDKIEIPDEEKCYTFDEAVDLTGHGSYSYMILFTTCLVCVATGLDMFGFSVVIAAASCDLKLGLAETGLLTSVPFTGILTALPWGYYADTRGRRRALLIATCAGFLLATLSSLSATWQVMLALKFLSSIFTTAAYSLTYTFLGECVGNKHRSQYIFIMNGVNQSSELFSFGLAYFILPLNIDVPLPWLHITYSSWRLLTFFMALPMGIGGLLLIYHFESPKFLANSGETEKALEVLRKMYVSNGGKEEEYPVKRLTIFVEGTKATSFWESLVRQTVPLFKPPLLLRTIQLFYLLIISCSTNNVFLIWFPTVINMFYTALESGNVGETKSFCERVVSNTTTSLQVDNFPCDDILSPNTLHSGMIYGTIMTVMTLALSNCASKRKLVLYGTFFISALSGVLTNVIKNPIANLIFYTLLQITVNGIGIVASYFADVYPTSYRCMVTSLGVMTARIASFSGVNLVAAVIVDHCELTFYCWAAFVFSGIIVTALLPSEKKPVVKLQGN